MVTILRHTSVSHARTSEGGGRSVSTTEAKDKKTLKRLTVTAFMIVLFFVIQLVIFSIDYYYVQQKVFRVRKTYWKFRLTDLISQYTFFFYPKRLNSDFSSKKLNFDEIFVYSLIVALIYLYSPFIQRLQQFRIDIITTKRTETETSQYKSYPERNWTLSPQISELAPTLTSKLSNNITVTSPPSILKLTSASSNPDFHNDDSHSQESDKESPEPDYNDKDLIIIMDENEPNSFQDRPKLEMERSVQLGL